MHRARLEAARGALMAGLIARGGGGGGPTATATATAAAAATTAAATAAAAATPPPPFSSIRSFAAGGGGGGGRGSFGGGAGGGGGGGGGRPARAAGAQRRAQDDSSALELARRALAATRLTGRGAGALPPPQAAGAAAVAAAAAAAAAASSTTRATTRVTFGGVRAAGDGGAGGGGGGGGGGRGGDRDRGGGGGQPEAIEGAVGVPPTFPVLPPGVPDFFGAGASSGFALSPPAPLQQLEQDPGAARLADDSGLARGADGGADATEARLFFRERLERAALPAAVRRAIFSGGWQELVYDVRRTAKVTTAGRLLAFKATVVVGNLDGLLGVGEARGASLQRVLLDAHMRAYERVSPVPRYRGHTLYHPVDATFHKARVQVWPRPAGAGVVASDALAALLELAGIKDATAKASGRRRHRGHVLKAFLAGLGAQSLPHDGVEGSGVYVREVLYGAGSAGRGRGREGGRLPWKMRRGVDLPA